MYKRFDLKSLLANRDALVARLELAFALERRPATLSPPPPPPAEADKAKRR